MSAAAEVLTRWEQIKREEKGVEHKSLLDGISEGLPGLLRAENVQMRAAWSVTGMSPLLGRCARLARGFRDTFVICLSAAATHRLASAQRAALSRT